MIQTYSHTFTFQTPNSLNTDETLENIISITEENAIKHYIHYTQHRLLYHENGTMQLLYRQCNIKVDRYYYLEIANIAIDDTYRRSRLYTVLGKRRFGANDNKLDPYLLNQEHDAHAIYGIFKGQRKSGKLHPVRHERIDNAVNKYEAFPFECSAGFFVVLHQENISPRHRFKKTFLLELRRESFFRLGKIETHESQIEHIFNEIGNIYFTSLPETAIDFNDVQSDLDETLSAIHQQNLNGNNTYQKTRLVELYKQLRNDSTQLESAYFDLYSKGLDLLDSLGDPLRATLCSNALEHFIGLLEPYSELEEMVSCLSAVRLFIDNGKLAYLLKKQDGDLQDIYIYALECLSEWNASATDDTGKAVHFAAATVDTTNALKHFLDSCIEFSHSYKCLDVKPATERPLEFQTEAAAAEPTMDHAIISAKEFFAEVELEHEVLDELYELTEEIEGIELALYVDDELKEGLITFFNGYVRMLNTFFEFKDLGYSLTLLSQKLAEYDTHSQNEMLTVIIRATVNDLLAWKQSVLVNQTAADIHFIDKSFYSNIAQLDMLFSEPAEMEEDAIEFF